MKYSRQRNIILDIVKGRYDHPTAEEVYIQAAETIPSIGIATVYRNLNQLADMGEIRRIPIVDGSDRFDGQLDEHYHMVCKHCGRLTDLRADEDAIARLRRETLQVFGVSESGGVEFAPAILEGVCDDCKMKS